MPVTRSGSTVPLLPLLIFETFLTPGADLGLDPLPFLPFEVVFRGGYIFSVDKVLLYKLGCCIL